MYYYVLIDSPYFYWLFVGWVLKIDGISANCYLISVISWLLLIDFVALSGFL